MSEGLFGQLQTTLESLLPQYDLEYLVSLTHEKNRETILRSMIGSGLLPVHYNSADGLIIVAKGFGDGPRTVLDGLRVANDLPPGIRELIMKFEPRT